MAASPEVGGLEMLEGRRAWALSACGPGPWSSQVYIFPRQPEHKYSNLGATKQVVALRELPAWWVRNGAQERMVALMRRFARLRASLRPMMWRSRRSPGSAPLGPRPNHGFGPDTRSSASISSMRARSQTSSKRRATFERAVTQSVTQVQACAVPETRPGLTGCVPGGDGF